MAPPKRYPDDIQDHLALLNITDEKTGDNSTAVVQQLQTTPLFSSNLRVTLENIPLKGPGLPPGTTAMAVLPQYGLMGMRLETYGDQSRPQNRASADWLTQEDEYEREIQPQDPRDALVYANINAPWSTFICGSQGSGKSHTLACMLENSLMARSRTGILTTPLTGLVLHYDKFTGIESGQLCEAAYLCSSGIPVCVLVSPSNFKHMKQLYSQLPGLPAGSKLPEVVPMRFLDKHLGIGMMKSLMAVGGEGGTPLYMEVVTKVLRDMAEEGKQFSFTDFKARLKAMEWVRGQSAPLDMRLRLLESFLDCDDSPPPPPKAPKGKSKGKHPKPGSNAPAVSVKGPRPPNDGWKFDRGSLTIIDLSCPFVDENDACALFNICLGIFLEGRDQGGRIVALDEAHKFLTTNSREASTLTESMLSLVRQQRHLATRVVIATQEPTLSQSLLDLCNVTIVHRFTSPAWFKVLKGHLAGVVMGTTEHKESRYSADSMFSKIVSLRTGEALVFCPNACLDVETEGDDQDDRMGLSAGGGSGSLEFRELGSRYIKMKMRNRITADGGRSILANQVHAI